MPSIIRNRLKKIKAIKMVILDVDGVLSDGRIIYGSDGTEFKYFHAHDGYGIARAIELGIQFAIISGRKSTIVERRAKILGIKEVYQNADNKVAAYEKLKKKYRLSNKEICFIGDDEFDIPLLNIVGFSAAPSNAVEQVKNGVDYIAKAAGGQGAVREILDMILKAKRLI